SAAAPEGPARAHPAEGAPPADTACRAGQQEDRLGNRRGLPMVQRPTAQAAGRHRQRGLVPCRHRAGADPLGAGARSDRRARARSFPQHRPGCDAGDDPRLVHLTLAGGDHLPGGSYSPWSRDPAPVVRSRHPAYHPGAAGAVLADHVWADGLARDKATALRPNAAAWYRKREPTFSDAIAAVRRVLWWPPDLSMSRQPGDVIEITAGLLNRVSLTLCLAA